MKLGILYTEKVHNATQATAAWQALLAQEPENRRAQDALKKLYLQPKDWNALEAFYASQNKWDELVRVLERQAETEDEAGRVGLWNKIGELYRDRLSKPDRAQKAYEKALSLRRPESARRAGADPALREVQGGQAAQRGAARRAGAHRGSRPSAVRGCSGWPTCSTWARATSAARCASRCRALAEKPTDEWAIATSRRLAAESGGWPELVEAYEAAVPRVQNEADEKAVLALLSTLAAAYERELANAETAIARNQTILEIAAKDPDAVAALERLYIATGRFADLLAVYDKKLELAKAKAEQLEIRFKLACLYEEEIKQPDKAIELYSAILEQDPAQLQALAALDRLYQQLGRWTDLAADDRQGDRPVDRHGGDRGAEVPARRRAGAVPG